MLSDFVVVAQAISGTTKKSVKKALLAEYFRTLDDPSLERAAVFFSGAPFPRREERVTGVGGSTIADAVVEATGRTAEELWAAWPRHADLGDTVAELFEDDPARTISLPQLGEFFDRIAATQGTNEKKAALVELFRRLDRQGARFVVKILQSEFRIGLQEGLVESAIAKAFGRELVAVRRANMFTGDIGAAALLARSGTLDEVRMALFQPVGLMLAQAEETAEKIVEALGAGAFADDKYDGIRAQIHTNGGEVRIYSRTLDQITHRFPEVAEAARALGTRTILDGELVAFNGRILPFAVIQTRLGRRKVSDKLLADAPVAFFAFDILMADGAPVYERPLRERLELLRGTVPASGAIRLGHQGVVEDAAQLDALFDQARARANEGLVVKDPDSIYTPGRRGKSWLKYKKALATLDCVVTAAEYGHGKRRNVLSDYTFAIRREGELLNIGKAYSGLTDAEIDLLTGKLKELTTGRYGPVHTVEPKIVLEIAFDRIQESKRHKSGYALRFPRIARIRDDKSVEEISTIDEVRRIYEGQLSRENLESVKSEA
jgi:DNA ligase-1